MITVGQPLPPSAQESTELMLSNRPQLMPLSLCVHRAPFWPFHKAKPTVCNGGLPDLPETKGKMSCTVAWIFSHLWTLYWQGACTMIFFFLLFTIYFSSILPHLLFGDLGNLYFFFFFGLYFLVLASPVFCPCSLCPKAQPQDI